MSVTVYLSNQQIQFLVGRTGTKTLKVTASYLADAPDGTIINGIIMDAERFIPFMRSCFESYKIADQDVNLVINSSKFVGRTMEIPMLNARKSQAFIAREFADMVRESDDVYGYIPLSTADNKVRRIYAEAVPSEFIKEYLDIFAEIGVNVKAIYSGESSIIGMTNVAVGKSHQTFVVEIPDHMTINTLLWVDGTFYHYNSTRCFHESGTQEYAVDVARSVSQIAQFMKANQIESPLECVMIAGRGSENVALFQEQLSEQGLQIPVQMFDDKMIADAGVDAQSFFHGASGMIVNGKSQNFLTQYRKRRTSTPQTVGESRTGAIVVGVTFAVMVVLLIIAVIVKTVMVNSYNKVVAYNTSPDTLLSVAEYDKQETWNRYLSKKYDDIKTVDDNLLTYPVCDENTLDIIEQCSKGYAEVEFNSFDASAGTVSILATSQTVDDINKFIKNLNKQDLFYSVDYTGYTFDDSKNLWDIHVTCTLAESAGR
jgi:hypothetical protein